MNFTIKKSGMTAIFLASSLLASTQAMAVDFSGQRVTLYAPGAAGNVLDVYTRLMAPLFEQYLPGNPTVIVRQIPGAGTIAGLNTFEQQGSPDGLHVTGISISGVMNYAFRDPNVNYNLQDWIPIIMTPQGSVVYAHADLGIESHEDVADLAGQELIYGGNNPSGGDLRILYMLDLLGLDVQTVWGVSRGPARLAFERGELNVNYDPVPVYITSAIDLAEAGQLVPLFTVGYIDDQGNVSRDPVLPDIPHFLEIYEQVHGEPLSGIEYDIWLRLQIMGQSSRFLALPGGTPDEIVEAYSDAIDAILADPQAVETLSVVFEGYEQIVGVEETRRILADMVTISDEVWDYVDNWLYEKEGVRLIGD